MDGEKKKEKKEHELYDEVEFVEFVSTCRGIVGMLCF